MKKMGIVLIALALLELASAETFARQILETPARPMSNEGCQSSPSAFPRQPFAQTIYTAPVPARSTGNEATTESPTVVFPSPWLSTARVYLTIESVAVKGTHPANAYLAFELRANSLVGRPQQGLAVRTVPETFASSTRHFLYQRFAPDATPIHIREDQLKLVVAPGARVYLGIQNSRGVAVERMAVTITGTLTDACLWGK